MNDFERMRLGELAISDRDRQLIDKLLDYYDKTPDSVPNQAAIWLWRDFKKWCELKGYDQQDINNAKNSIAHLI